MASGQDVFHGEEISTLTSQAVAWLTRLGVVQHGHISDMFVTLKTVIQNPIAQASCDSRISISRWLEAEGWNRASGGRESSLQSKKYNPDAPLEYFLLLKGHLSELSLYDDRYGFRHTQGKAYYDCLWCCFSRAMPDSCLFLLLSRCQAYSLRIENRKSIWQFN